jgi:hypothetical protein
MVRVGVHAHPPITISKVAVYAPAERADTLPLFHLYALYVLCAKNIRNLHYHLALLSSPSLNFKNHFNHPLPPPALKREGKNPNQSGRAAANPQP